MVSKVKAVPLLLCISLFIGCGPLNGTRKLEAPMVSPRLYPVVLEKRQVYAIIWEHRRGEWYVGTSIKGMFGEQQGIFGPYSYLVTAEENITMAIEHHWKNRGKTWE